MYRGDGYEFVELRAYVPGDDVRRIDWAASARSGDLQTRIVLEDVALTLGAALDTSPSMRIGRQRPLLDAAREAISGWFAAAMPDDRCIRIGSASVTPPVLRRHPRAVVASFDEIAEAFDLRACLATARAALPRGAAFLLVGDLFELDAVTDATIADLGARLDCTALIARDPWYDGLPLRGVVRMRGLEGGAMRLYIGPRERAAYLAAVRAREARVIERLTRANWRVAILDERGGATALADAFGLPPPRERAS
jgi:uncharacterized protein (DUF58 family)